MASVRTLASDSEGSDEESPRTLISKLSWRRQGRSRSSRSSWKPNAFRLLPLASIIIASWTLIVTLQLLLVKSQRDGGVIIADSLEDIALDKSFLYKYLPTIIALIYSVFWSWIDLQVKRLEPYHQLSKSDGAWGKDSLLLSYPFDFLPFVPLSAFKRRHWAVLWASLSIMFVTWGVVPIQAGIFATETIQLSSGSRFRQSTGFIPASKQSDKVDGSYIYSAHGIIWLNETLPPYMTRDYALAPFELQDKDVTLDKSHSTWTSKTTLYSLDMNCELPGVDVRDELQMNNGFDFAPTTVQTSQWVSSNGCGFPTSYYAPIGNETIGPNAEMNNMSAYDTKDFTSIYIGQYPTEWADYYLQTYCPSTANHTFMAWFAKNKQRAEDPPNPVTRLYCTPYYFEQEVVATIDATTKAPINYTATGDKMALSAKKWNSTFFETQMNTGKVNEFNRATMPFSVYPDQLETVSSYPISLANFGTILQPMAGYIIGVSRRPLEELLDPHALADAYQAVYRIVFARSMTVVLDQDFNSTTSAYGRYDYTAAAVVMVPAFTYVVEGLLGFVSICGIVLFTISLKRKWSLCSDPATIAGVQSLVADNPALLREFSTLDRASAEEIVTNLENKKFKLERDEQGVIITEADSFDPLSNNAHGPVRFESEESQASKPVRPREFRSFMVIPFVLVQVALAIVLGVLLRKSQPLGIVRPSTNPIVRQILENYIPTALATLIEPIWILINRLLCLLQPLEELRGGHAVASRSIDADYSSLPPQLVIFKALKLSHFKLAAVCTMALLANLLAVAFSGMFDERSILVPQALQLDPPYEAKFLPINGTVSPSMPAIEKQRMKNPAGAYIGGLGINQFMVAESNYTAGNPLPAWVDNEFLYVPFMNETNYGGREAVESRTAAFGSTLECSVIPSNDYSIVLKSDFSDSYANISMTMRDETTGQRFTCLATELEIERGPAPASGIPAVCDTGKLAMEFVLRIDAAANATRAERDFCLQTAFMGYIRPKDGWCEAKKNNTATLDDSTAMFIGCRSKLVAGEANVRVDPNGRVEEVTDVDVSATFPSEFFTEHFTNGTLGRSTAGGADDLIAQANGYIFYFRGKRYHNDSYATDFLNYFMIKQSNDSRLMDPNSPLPTLSDITGKLYPVYRKLFAIWLGINKDRLLVPRKGGSTSVIGKTNEPQIRIFLSKPLFVMAEIILAVYAVVAVCIYLWRPDKFLPRMPTSIGAIIALFAAGDAVQDMRQTSLYTRKKRRQHLEKIGAMYGYGKFVGVDGLPYEGIEKEPFVNAVPLPGVMEKVQTGFSQKSFGLRRDKGH